MIRVPNYLILEAILFFIYCAHNNAMISVSKYLVLRSDSFLSLSTRIKAMISVSNYLILEAILFFIYCTRMQSYD